MCSTWWVRWIVRPATWGRWFICSSRPNSSSDPLRGAYYPEPQILQRKSAVELDWPKTNHKLHHFIDLILGPGGGGLEQEMREWITSLWSGSFSQLYTSMTVYIKPPLRMPQSVTNSYRFETDVTWEIPDPGDLNRRWRTAPPSFDFYHSTRYNSYLPRLTFRIVPDHKMLCLWSNIFLHRS